jgi:hypothetical protein
MSRLPFQIGHHRDLATTFSALMLLVLAIQPIIAESAEPGPEANTQVLERAVVPMMKAENKDALPLTLDGNTLSYSLPEGETTLIVHVAKPSLLDRFTFVNENIAARGELRIAVSNDSLPASDPRWSPVDGNIRFSHKRLFNLSMVGVEAKYVKLSFYVEKEGRIAAVGF